MKININSQMNYRNIINKLKKGVALSKRQEPLIDITRYGTEAERLIVASASRTGQLEGLGQADILAQVQSGDFLPNEFYGWSTKTLLAGLVILLLIKVKRAKR